jgi:hypothetical protein
MKIDEVSFYMAQDSPYGKTYGNWTVEWWRWALSTPKSINPVIDKFGEYACIEKQDRDVIFLAGKLAEEEGSFPERRCTIPANKSILFPVINCECNPLEYPELKTYHDLIDHVRRDEDTIISRECYVNGRRVPALRISSDPIVFRVSMAEDNIFEVKGGGSTYASADGYWVFLKPLDKGQHRITFQGSCENGRLRSGAIYDIDVV